MAAVKTYYFDEINYPDRTEDFDYQYQQYLEEQEAKSKKAKEPDEKHDKPKTLPF
jgi:hypothetical protein